MTYELTDDEWSKLEELRLSAGNVNNIKVTPRLLDALALTNAIVMADKAYCSRKFLRLIESKGGSPYIPCKKTYKRPWEIDTEQYKKNVTWWNVSFNG